MTIELSDQLDRFVREKIASGEYATEQEVLAAAFRSLQAEDAEVSAIEAGLKDVAAGRTKLLDEADAAIRAARPFLNDG
ncbi:MAG: type II toxin-antitoxin system ParD family antitoxin [Planctomycetota bacterium]